MRVGFHALGLTVRAVSAAAFGAFVTLRHPLESASGVRSSSPLLDSSSL